MNRPNTGVTLGANAGCSNPSTRASVGSLVGNSQANLYSNSVNCAHNTWLLENMKALRSLNSLNAAPQVPRVPTLGQMPAANTHNPSIFAPINTAHYVASTPPNNNAYTPTLSNIATFGQAPGAIKPNNNAYAPTFSNIATLGQAPGALAKAKQRTTRAKTRASTRRALTVPSAATAIPLVVASEYSRL